MALLNLHHYTSTIIPDEGGKADVCKAIDEYGNDMKIVGFITGKLSDGFSLEEAIKAAASIYSKTEEYIKEVYDEVA